MVLELAVQATADGGDRGSQTGWSYAAEEERSCSAVQPSLSTSEAPRNKIMPSKKLYGLQLASGNTPPSQGVLLNERARSSPRPSDTAMTTTFPST